jgi:hypothetical protein
MAVTYETAEEAYATRQKLWEERQLQEHDAEPAAAIAADAVPAIDRFMFDLQGFFVLEGAVGAAEIAEINAQVDALNPAAGKAMGLAAEEAQAMMNDPHNPAGKDMQQGFGTAAGGVGLGSHPCFDALIDHPGYIKHIKDFTDGEGTRLKSRFGVMERWPGQASGIHGGRMAREVPANTFGWRDDDGEFHCQQVSVLLALNDCPEHGGNTSVVVSSTCKPTSPSLLVLAILKHFCLPTSACLA